MRPFGEDVPTRTEGAVRRKHHADRNVIIGPNQELRRGGPGIGNIGRFGRHMSNRTDEHPNKIERHRPQFTQYAGLSRVLGPEMHADEANISHDTTGEHGGGLFHFIRAPMIRRNDKGRLCSSSAVQNHPSRRPARGQRRMAQDGDTAFEQRRYNRHMRCRRRADYCGAHTKVVGVVKQIVHRGKRCGVEPAEEPPRPVNRCINGSNELEPVADRHRIGVAAAGCPRTDKGNGDQ